MRDPTVFFDGHLFELTLGIFRKNYKSWHNVLHRHVLGVKVVLEQSLTPGLSKHQCFVKQRFEKNHFNQFLLTDI